MLARAAPEKPGGLGEPIPDYQDKPGTTGQGGGNGGFQLANLVDQFGPARIILLGFDMHGGHWHGAHPIGMGNPDERSFAAWIETFAANAHRFRAEIINCTPGSALTCFSRATLDAVV